MAGSIKPEKQLGDISFLKYKFTDYTMKTYMLTFIMYFNIEILSLLLYFKRLQNKFTTS